MATARYVDINNPSPTAAYTSWATAAAAIQDAVNAAVGGDAVWVTNGIHDTGARPASGQGSLNRVVINNDITVVSVNGPDYAFIVGEN